MMFDNIIDLLQAGLKPQKYKFLPPPGPDGYESVWNWLIAVAFAPPPIKALEDHLLRRIGMEDAGGCRFWIPITHIKVSLHALGCLDEEIGEALNHQGWFGMQTMLNNTVSRERLANLLSEPPLREFLQELRSGA